MHIRADNTFSFIELPYCVPENRIKTRPSGFNVIDCGNTITRFKREQMIHPRSYNEEEGKEDMVPKPIHMLPKLITHTLCRLWILEGEFGSSWSQYQVTRLSCIHCSVANSEILDQLTISLSTITTTNLSFSLSSQKIQVNM